ncbi:PREDICTED: metalloprotease TIKI2 isoform X4 [Nanorana parkeri]|uniref:metalloprotease TIKI2 isoform X4 n=1 Tax=Nanorana parkeri TaxID=125878 RepID=UPI000853F7EC|nr:PREDICTED: metalloprotease TIKI2 isoform X4 [Nanorana parkeri]
MWTRTGLLCFVLGTLMLQEMQCRRLPMYTGQCGLPKSQEELNSFLWTVKRNPPAYLFGTIHVPYTRVWDYIPQNSKKAFQESTNVYFELDLTDPYTISALASCQMLPQGENLQDVLPKDLYRRLKRHLEYVKLMMPHWMTPDQRGKGLYADYLFNAIAGNWERKRPVWVMLMVNSLTEADIRSRGVPVLDLYLAQEADRMRKKTGAVERVEEQCHPLNRLNLSQVLFALNQTLLQHESLRAGSFQAPYTTEDLIKHYNCGDLNTIIFNHDTSQLPTFINTTLPSQEQVTAQEIDIYFRQELIYKRNERMARRVMGLLKENRDKSFFFAFGAGHFLGNYTVIDVLKQGGYDVEHTLPGQAATGTKPRKDPIPAEEMMTDEPSLKYFDHIPSTSSSPEDSDDEMLPPHLLLPDSISQLEEFGKHKKWYRRHHRNQHRRQFNDLWVRLDDSTTTMPSSTRNINGEDTADSLLWLQDGQDDMYVEISSVQSSATPKYVSTLSAALFATLTLCIITVMRTIS